MVPVAKEPPEFTANHSASGVVAAVASAELSSPLP